MTLVGFPDFQEQAQWQSPPAVLYAQAFSNGASITFPLTGPVNFNVSNWQSTQLSIFFGGGPVDVTMYWYDAIPFTQLLGRRLFTAIGTASQVITVPNIGPYLKVQIDNNTGGASTLQVAILFTNRIAPPFSNPSALPVITRAFAGILGGASVTVVGTYLYAGPATFAINHDSNEGWLGVISSRNSANVQTEVAYLGDRLRQSGDLSQTVILPPQPVSLTIFNLGAAAHSFSAAVTPDVFR